MAACRRSGVEALAGAVPLIVGIGELTTQAVAKARFAEQAGADRLMVIPVSYWKFTEAEIFGHFEAIAGATSLLIMIYNNPATSGVDMSPTLMVRMVREIAGVDLIKESGISTPDTCHPRTVGRCHPPLQWCQPSRARSAGSRSRRLMAGPRGRAPFQDFVLPVEDSAPTCRHRRES